MFLPPHAIAAMHTDEASAQQNQERTVTQCSPLLNSFVKYLSQLPFGISPSSPSLHRRRGSIALFRESERLGFRPRRACFRSSWMASRLIPRGSSVLGGDSGAMIASCFDRSRSFTHPSGLHRPCKLAWMMALGALLSLLTGLQGLCNLD